MNPAKGKVAGKVAYVHQKDRIVPSVRRYALHSCPTCALGLKAPT